MDDLLREFLTETNESLDVVDVELVRFEQEPNNVQILGNIFRLVHTIKGTCGFLGLPRLEALAHSAETLMGRFRDGMGVTPDAVTLILFTIDRIKEILDELEKSKSEPAGVDADLIRSLQAMATGQNLAAGAAPVPPQALAVAAPALASGEVSAEELERVFRETPGPAPRARPLAETRVVDSDEERIERKIAGHSIRVGVDTLEHLMTMVSELVLTRNQLLDIVRRHEDSEFKAPLQRLSNVTAELQDGVMKTRMQPIGHAWQKLPRIVRDLASELDKDIELEMHGADTELDRQVLEQIKDPLTHMVRNAADHGLESRAARRAAGKPERGTIRLSAYQEGGHVIVRIADDGRGLDTARIRQKALSAGLASEADLEAMSDGQVQRFIFEPGISTAPTVTSISGRGVGMDVVRTHLDQLGGTIDVNSIRGEGLSFTLKIPLTLAIVSALIVNSGGERFAIPQLAVLELVRIHGKGGHRIERIKDAGLLRLRDKLLPLLHLKTLLKLEAAAEIPERGFIVVMQVGRQTFGLVVDGVFHTEEIVVKAMSSKLRSIALFSGNTILGDGSVIMILEPNGLAQMTGSVASSTAAAALFNETSAHSGPEQSRTALLVFRAGSREPKAVPLSLITRLEEIDGRRIEISDGRHVVQYRGQLMPLVRVNDSTRLLGEGAHPLLVFADGGRSMGLVVDEIVDIVEEVLDIELAGEGGGVLGSAIVRGLATEIIDISHFLPLAGGDWFRRAECAAAATRTLLFVDDSAFFRNMLTPVLTAAGYAVTTMAGAREAMATLRAGRRFDVVVTDVDMPDMDGFAFAAAIREQTETAAMPIIALSAYRAPEALERGRSAGFNDFVAKFDRQSLVASLKALSADALPAWEGRA